MPSVSLARALAIALGLAAAPALAVIDVPAAVAVFGEAKIICERDAGAFWGHSLCGPILIVDPTDSAIVANQADTGGVLKASGAAFAGVLPQTEIVANTSVSWSGTTWSELLWPLPDDTAKRRVMLAHELFHRIQPDLGIARLDGDNRHLDTLEGRYLLQLEWRALAKALAAPTAAARKAAVGDALAFRHERYRLVPAAAAEEGKLESNEGVAEYTGVRLGLATAQERTAYAIRDLSAYVDAPSFVRSFAYATGPAYGLLLDQADPAWRAGLKSGWRFDEMLGATMGIPAAAPADIGARAARYDDGALRAREVARDAAKRAEQAALQAKFVGGPILVLPLGHFSYQFNPQMLIPLGTTGTIYPRLRLTDAWGVLDAPDGALMNQDGKVATVSLAGADPSGLKGDGWTLALKPGWTVRPGARKGDLIVSPTGGSAR